MKTHIHEAQKCKKARTNSERVATLGYTTLRAIPACIVCDLPANRKICGFSNFNATYGCSKCMNKFENLVKNRYTEDLIVIIIIGYFAI